MATGTVVFQTSTTATPPSGLAVMADAVNDSDHGAGTAQYIKIMDGATAGTAKASVTTANGLAVDVTRVQGTSQVLGTTQPLAGSVHVANTAAVLGSVSVQGYVAHDAVAAGNPVLFGAFGSSGTQAAVADGDMVRLWADLNGRLQIRGTIDSMPAVNVSTGTIPGGTIQAFGTTEVLGTVRALTTVTVTVGTIAEGTINNFTGTIGGGTFQPLLGTVVAIGSVAHGAAADVRPVLFAGFGSSGTQAAVDDGDAVRAWFDLNGRQIIRGTIDSLPSVTGTVQTHGTSQVLGSVQTVGTSQALGTVQPLAGSVHLASNLPGGSINAQGVIAHGAAAAGNPVLFGAFGSSGTQAAVDDGDITRLWTDLNGRLQIRGTIDSMPITTVTGTVQAHGTNQALGTVQPLAGSVHVANTATIQGTVRTRPALSSEGFFGTRFTAATTNGTLVPAPGQGTAVRVWGLIASGSAAGSAFFEFGDGTVFGAIFTAANGGMVYTSAKGIRTNGTNQDIFFNCAAGTWGVSVEYTLEN